jgi:ParB family chromosome partitioning protein
MTKKGLGRGLHTLLPARKTETHPTAPVSSHPLHPQTPATPAPLTKLSVDVLEPNPFQPRAVFEEVALEELAASIRSDGIIQPIVVRKAGEKYQIIAGERRWRASRIAGLTEVPVHVQELADDRMLEVALIENIQREDLNPIETAIAFHRMNDELGLNHDEIGKRTGKDRATVTNFIRLLQLPDDLQKFVASRQLSAGHARALLRLTDPKRQRDLAQTVIQRALSVRALEAMVADLEKRDAAPAAPKAKVEEKPIDPNVRAAIDDLERALGTRVRIVEKGNGKGRVEIDYFSAEELDRLYSIITGNGA